MYRKILGIWFKYGEPITHSTNATYIEATDIVTNLKNGTYKAKLTATVSSKTASDSITAESTDST